MGYFVNWVRITNIFFSRFEVVHVLSDTKRLQMSSRNAKLPCYVTGFFYWHQAKKYIKNTGVKRYQLLDIQMLLQSKCLSVSEDLGRQAS